MTKKYGIFNENGAATSFYSDDINVIPANAIALTDAQYQDLISNQGARAWDSATSAVVDAVIPLSEIQAVKIATLTAACAAAIIGGYSSSALGSAYTYASQLTDQANLVQTAASSAGGNLWCKNSASVWSFMAHSQAQAQAVLADFVTFRNKQQQRLVTLTSQVSAATTSTAVQAIIWATAA